MTEELKNNLIEVMAENLTMLRAKLDLTQAELAEVVGISRYTLIAIETKQRKMTWNTFLSLLLVFSKNESTYKLLEAIGVYNSELNDFLNLKSIGKVNGGQEYEQKII